MTENELEDLKEIEKDFDKETAKKLLRLGYRKVFFETQCENCGKMYLKHINRRGRIMERMGQDGLTLVNVNLCNECEDILNGQISVVNDNFYCGLKYRKEE